MAREVDAEVEGLDYGSHDGYVLKEVERIVGKGLRAHLAGDPKLKPAKLSQLAVDGIRPLTWYDLDTRQQKELDRILPIRQPDSLVRYGDSVIVVGDAVAWKKRQKRKDAFKRAEEKSHLAQTSTKTLSREIGVEVTE